MTLGWVIAGTILMLALSSFLGLGAIFGGAGYVNSRDCSGYHFSRFENRLLTSAIFVLPLSCWLPAGLVIYQYAHDGSSRSYLWYLLPFITVLFYLIALLLGRNNSKSSDSKQ